MLPASAPWDEISSAEITRNMDGVVSGERRAARETRRYNLRQAMSHDYHFSRQPRLRASYNIEFRTGETNG
jgi:hypothetical protein